MEGNAAVLSSSQLAWSALLAAAPPTVLTAAISPQLTSMLFDLACTPAGYVLPPKHMLRFPMPASSDALLPAGSGLAAAKHVLGGEEGFDVANMRLAVAQALGQLGCKLATSGTTSMQGQLACHFLQFFVTWKANMRKSILWYKMPGPPIPELYFYCPRSTILLICLLEGMLAGHKAPANYHADCTITCSKCGQGEGLMQQVPFCSAGGENPITAPLLRHLCLHSATSRITAALTVTAWLHALQEGRPSSDPPETAPAPSLPADIVQALSGCLTQQAVVVTAEGAIQPYTELTAMYTVMQKQAQVCPQHHQTFLTRSITHHVSYLLTL